jgi:hypothetical protein
MDDLAHCVRDDGTVTTITDNSVGLIAGAGVQPGPGVVVGVAAGAIVERVDDGVGLGHVFSGHHGDEAVVNIDIAVSKVRDRSSAQAVEKLGESYGES